MRPTSRNSGQSQASLYYPPFGSRLIRASPRRGREAERLVANLYNLATIRWEPSVADWWEAGRLIRIIGDKQDWDINKRRDFQNDALIALTAGRHGATVVTANSSDFELLRAALRITVLPAK